VLTPKACFDTNGGLSCHQSMVFCHDTNRLS
jgi:hypothetical protein